MKPINFISQDEPNINSLIQGLDCEVDDNNNVLITWEWPRDNNIKMAAVFQVNTGEEDLAELLENHRGAVIITKGMEGSYNKPLEREKVIFKVFPACFGKNGEVLVLNQQHGNTTGQIFAKIPVYYSIVYKEKPLSRLQRVFIKIEISDQYDYIPKIKAQDLLVYEKDAGGYTISYPVDEAAIAGGLSLYIKKSEKIYIKPKAPYENIVSMHKEVL